MMRSIHTLSVVVALVLFFVVTQESAICQQTAGQLYEQGLYLEEGKGELKEALEKYEAILKQFPNERTVGARAQLHIGLCLEKLGLKEATRAYQKVIADFPDQKQVVNEARTRLAALRQFAAEPARNATGMRLRKVADVERTVYPQQVALIGSVSPDGKYLSFVDWDTGDLAVFDVGTGEMRRITHKGSWEDSSANAEQSIWSRDGRKLAYLWDDYRTPSLCIIDVEGLKPRTVLRDTSLIWAAPYDWSPDGESILALLQRKDLARQIALVSAVDGSTRQILAPPYGNWPDFPVVMSFSPDGRKIAYDLRASGNERGHDIYLYSVDNGKHVPLVTHPADDYLLGWTRDSREILFASSRTGSYGLWAVRVDETKVPDNPHLITPDIGRVNPLGVTRDGSFYYSPPFGNTPDIYTVDYNPSDGKVASPPIKIIRDFEGTNITPAYSPCGKYLAYISGFHNRKSLGGDVVCIQPLEDGPTREIRPPLQSFGYPRWSWDSQSLYLVGLGEDQRPTGIYRMDLHDGNVTPIVIDRPAELRGHALTRDGKSIILARTGLSNQSWKITLRALGGESEKELFHAEKSTFYCFDLSPDGEQLAILSRSPGSRITGIRVSVGSVAGGMLKEICRPERIARQLAWAADGKHILLCMGTSGKWGLWRVSSAGGEPEYLDTEMIGEMRHLTAHPDGKGIAFFAHGPIRNAELWAIENLTEELKTPYR